MTLRVLFIARYRDATMHRKVELLAEEPDLLVRQVVPRRWEDELIAADADGSDVAVDRLALAMFGRPNDPHRAVYRSLSLGMRQFKPDIIHAEEEPDSLAALQIGLARRAFAPRARLVLSTWQNVDRPRQPLVALVRSVSLGQADAILCANREALSIVRRLGFKRRAEVLPPIGVDTRFFHPPEKTLAIPVTFSIGYVGRFVPEKGIETLIEAVSLLRKRGEEQVRLILMGAGAHMLTLTALVNNLDHEQVVEFATPRPPSGVADFLPRLDVLVLPSRTTRVWKEQFGRVLVEAMACGVPVVGSDSGAIPEVIGDSGLTFHEGNAHALAECLHRLILDRALRDGLSASGKARVREHYTVERIEDQTASFYRSLLP